MKICFKMKNTNDPQLVNALFILSEARLGKKYGRILATIYISNQHLRNGIFPAVLGYHINFMNIRRWMTNRHNNIHNLKQYNKLPMMDHVLDSEDSKKVENFKNALDEKYPVPNNINSAIELEKWSEFIDEKKHKPVNQLTNKLLEQEAK